LYIHFQNVVSIEQLCGFQLRFLLVPVHCVDLPSDPVFSSQICIFARTDLIRTFSQSHSFRPLSNLAHFVKTSFFAPEVNRYVLKTVNSCATMKWYYKNGVATTHSTLFGYRRRNVFILLAIILCSIILIIGLSVGLTRNKSSTYFPSIILYTYTSQNLPLPGNTGGIFTGDLTYYATGLGSCGITSTDADMICAISHELYGTSHTL
jgi:hypothetical protein